MVLRLLRSDRVQVLLRCDHHPLMQARIVLHLVVHVFVDWVDSLLASPEEKFEHEHGPKEDDHHLDKALNHVSWVQLQHDKQMLTGSPK